MKMLFKSILGSGLLVLLLSSNSVFASTNHLNPDINSQNINTQASTIFYSTAIQNTFGTYAVTCQPCPPGKICPQMLTANKTT